MVVLIVVQATDRSEQFELRFDAALRITVGRDPGCHVQLPDVSVSSNHATLVQEGEGYEVVDEGSTNGTRLNGKTVPAGQRRTLREGDSLLLGRALLKLSFSPLEEKAPGLPPSTADMALAMVRGSLLDSGTEVAVAIRVVVGPAAGLSVLVQDDRTLRLGSASGSEILLPGVAPQHARVAVRGGRLWVVDLGSHAGTQLNGRALDPNDSVLWTSGMRLAIGSHVLLMEDPVNSALQVVQSAPDEAILGVNDPHWGLGGPPSSRRDSVEVRADTYSVLDQKGKWLGASTSSFGSAPGAPIEAVSYRDAEPPDLPRTTRRHWTLVDTSVVAVAGLTVLLSCLALAWFLNG